MKRPFEIRIVLVRTIYDRNIGATARAMTNMGCDHLILIDPQCELTYDAQQAAASGQKPLQNRTVYKNWDDFLTSEPESIRVCFTARDGKGRNVRDLNEVLEFIEKQTPQFQTTSDVIYPIHFIFGPEDWGLSGDDLELAHFCATIPTYGENWSLNLAQATLLAMFALRQKWGGRRTQLDGQQPPRIQHDRADLFPEETLKQWLIALGFDLSKRRINVYTVLKRLLLQNTPTKKELRILETVLQQNIRKLKEWKNFQNLK